MRRAHVDADHVQSLDTVDVIRSVNATMKSTVFILSLTALSPVNSQLSTETEFFVWIVGLRKGCDKKKTERSYREEEREKVLLLLLLLLLLFPRN